MTPEVELKDIVKAYGATRAIDGVSLAVAKGELVALLGPSGCGKTTTLRAIAGFVEPTFGTVHLRGKDVTRLAPHKRDAGMVFQSYALFPHLTVAENVAFGLKRRGVARDEVGRRVAEMLKMMQIEALSHRLPRELSGGQQQRVAVGRALVINPAVLLLDEPFSNLDALLRESTRLEMRRLQQELGLTAVLVTHDQAEAMAIADRIAVMEKGRIVQVDGPQDLYRRPKTRFVAGFIGRANIFEGRVARRGADGVRVAAEGIDFLLPPGAEVPEACAVVLRPETIRLEAGTAAPAANGVAGTVEIVSFLGSIAQLTVLAGGRRLLAEGPGELAGRFPPGTAVVASWPAEALVACAA
jgi:putative spermidine/putrescine transport system ATP-binding protein